jgi:hypothetical protein
VIRVGLSRPFTTISKLWGTRFGSCGPAGLFVQFTSTPPNWGRPPYLRDCSSGQQQRHRLNRGGDRQVNSALWFIVITRMVYGPRTVEYVERWMKEGRTKKEAMRCLNRYIAREVYNLFTAATRP